jgi:phosphoglucosamine mutase
LGINFIEAEVGDRHVMDQLIKNNAVLGGEGSGHIICLNKSTSGDGIIAALQVLEVLCKSKQSLYNLKKNMNKYPQVLINIKTDAEVNLINNERLSDAVKVIESKLSDKGRVLIRKSGTEPLIRVMVESIDSDLANESANYLAEIIKSK